MQKLKPYHMENLYTTLNKTPCGSYIEGKKQELTEKQKQRFLSGTTIHEVHRLLGTAFQYAVEWGIIASSNSRYRLTVYDKASEFCAVHGSLRCCTRRK